MRVSLPVRLSGLSTTSVPEGSLARPSWSWQDSTARTWRSSSISHTCTEKHLGGATHLGEAKERRGRGKEQGGGGTAEQLQGHNPPTS